ncbi:tripartite tricarboxylate transporter TctB family protein [Pararhodobacter zhoushanensis]|uniref:Tripartite tricarboxylate transporter TctB family protein n=1 Tax=Pararhodobacter zhoushanensis TaxID=2479545 RepID=A0ABT3GXR8_9RHOB|nr:tripartite tricarboxylate transporter TctB family protein [Pararhodobacter zhoushanensis]MCW1932316.1 tripartite tricarboxylate transporter TctB family protein [Pararhodobacter zhoushanensis]
MLERLRPRASELIACAAIIGFGIAGLVIAQDYQFGSIRRMGPGFFPAATSVVIVLLAIASAVEAVAQPPSETEAAWRPLVFVSLAVIAWASLIDSAGLLPATVAMIFIAALARPPFKPVALFLLSAGICISGYLIFIKGLHMPLSLLGR